jgi:hypothetical protein
MTKNHAAKARKNAWTPEARRKRELTMQRKRAEREATDSVEMTAEQLAAAVAVPTPAKRGRKPKVVATGTNAVAIQLLEMALTLLKEGQ